MAGANRPHLGPATDGGIKPRAGHADDRNSLFAVRTQHNQSYFVLAAHDGQELATSTSTRTRPTGAIRHSRSRRPVHRPVALPPRQTVAKGICLFADPRPTRQGLRPNRKVTVAFNTQRQGDRQAGCSVERLRVDRGDVHRPAESARRPDTSSLNGDGGAVNSMSRSTSGRVSGHVDAEGAGEAECRAKGARQGDRVYGGRSAGPRSATGCREVRWPIWFYVLLVAHPAAPRSTPRNRPRDRCHRADGSFTVSFVARPDLTVPEADNRPSITPSTLT